MAAEVFDVPDDEAALKQGDDGIYLAHPRLAFGNLAPALVTQAVEVARASLHKLLEIA